MRSSPRSPGNSGGPVDSRIQGSAAHAARARGPAHGRSARTGPGCPGDCRVMAATAGGANRPPMGWRGVLPPRNLACRGQRLQAAQRAGRDRGRAVPATPACRRRRSPARARNERPDNRRAVASPVLIPRLRGVRARGAVVPPIVPVAGTCVAGRSAVGFLPARMVPVGHVVPRGFLQRRDGALPDLRPAPGKPGALGSGLRVCTRLVCAADGGHRCIRRVGAREPDQAPLPGGADPRPAGAPAGRGMAGVRGVGRAKRGVQAPGVRIPARTVPFLQRQLRAQRRVQGPVHAGEGTGPDRAAHRPQRARPAGELRGDAERVAGLPRDGPAWHLRQRTDYEPAHRLGRVHRARRVGRHTRHRRNRGAAAPAADCRAALHPDLQRGHVPHAVSGTVPAVSHAHHAAACAGGHRLPGCRGLVARGARAGAATVVPSAACPAPFSVRRC